jgi:hypothetical protein
MTFTDQVSADQDVQTVSTRFYAPLDSLTIPSVWNLEDMDREDITFEHTDNDMVDFDIVVGKLLKGATLNELQKQLKKFVDGKAKSIPLLEKGLGVSFDAETLSELRASINDDIELVNFGKIDWIKFTLIGEYSIETISDEYSDIVTLQTFVINYVALIKNRLHIFSFTAPLDVYEDYLDLYEATMQMICQ